MLVSGVELIDRAEDSAAETELARPLRNVTFRTLPLRRGGRSRTSFHCAQCCLTYPVIIPHPTVFLLTYTRCW